MHIVKLTELEKKNLMSLINSFEGGPIEIHKLVLGWWSDFLQKEINEVWWIKENTFFVREQ